MEDKFSKIDTERLIMVPLFVFLLFTSSSEAYSYLTKHAFSDLISILHIVHRGLVICFYLLIVILFFKRSRARATSRSFPDKVLAYVGTFLPFLLIFMKNPETGRILALLSISIMMCGMLFILYSLKTLGRSFGIVAQVRVFVQRGPYRMIRHPLYAGEILVFGGAVLEGFTIIKLLLFLVLVTIQSFRAIQEEKVLEENIPEYAQYKATTKRFIPGII